MMLVDFEISFVVPSGTSNDDFEAFLGRILDELEKIGYDEVDLTATLSQHRATFSLDEIEEDDFGRLPGDLRTALHAAGCGTAGWEAIPVLRADLSNGDPLPA